MSFEGAEALAVDGAKRCSDVALYHTCELTPSEEGAAAATATDDDCADTSYSAECSCADTFAMNSTYSDAERAVHRIAASLLRHAGSSSLSLPRCGTASATAASSPAAAAASLKQRQRLLARRHLNLTRRLCPRLSPLEAKMIVSSFSVQMNGGTLEERRLADEAAYWAECVASATEE